MIYHPDRTELMQFDRFGFDNGSADLNLARIGTAEQIAADRASRDVEAMLGIEEPSY